MKKTLLDTSISEISLIKAEL